MPELMTALNAMREAVIENDHLHHQYIPALETPDDLPKYGAAVNQYPSTQNAFMDVLMNRIVFTAIQQNNNFGNPLAPLRGERLPLGYAGQEIYTNPAQARTFNDDDFIGLLQKYEADTKVQYFNVNSEQQYAVSIGRNRLEQAFVSFPVFEEFVGSIIDSLYKGFYIDDFNHVKGLVSAAYNNNHAVVEVVNPLTSTSNIQGFLKSVRSKYFTFGIPSTANNAWNLSGGDGDPITTWSDPKDIYFIVRGDVRATIDVDYLAGVFNLDRAEMLGRIIVVDNFDIIDRKTGQKIFDGSKILGIMADSRWFKIREQRLQLDQFYNANNMVWNYYLQAFMMYQYSLFANAVIFATQANTVNITNLTLTPSSNTYAKGDNPITLTIGKTPVNGTTPITFAVTDADDADVDANDYTLTPNGNNTEATLVFNTANVDGDITVTAKAGAVTADTTIAVTGD